jgi:hypothetical protein
MDNNPAADPQTNLGPEDCYMDGPYLVFTAAYHLKRGYCCFSSCRHCPYGRSTPRTNVPPTGPDSSAPTEQNPWD